MHNFFEAFLPPAYQGITQPVMPDSFCRLRCSALRSVTVFCHWPATSS